MVWGSSSGWRDHSHWLKNPAPGVTIAIFGAKQLSPLWLSVLIRKRAPGILTSQGWCEHEMM